MRQIQRNYSALVVVAFGLCVLGNAHAQTPNKDTNASQKGLLGHWRFDDGRGETAKDSSGRGNHGVIHNGQWAKGKFGVALRFDGEGTYVSLPKLAGLDRSDELTVEAWVFWEGMGRYPNIITGGGWNPGGFLIFVDNDRCSFRLGRPGGVAWEAKTGWQEVGAGLLSRFVLGRWYYLAATFKRPAITTYADGKPVGAANWNHPVGCFGETHIGRWELGTTQFHHGLIDEVRVYNRALTPDEIKASCAKEAPRRR